MFISSMWDVKEPTHYSKRVSVKFPGVVAVLCVVTSGLVLHIGITSCTFPPWTDMSKKNDYEVSGTTFALDSAFVILAHKKNTSAAQFKSSEPISFFDKL